MLMGPQSASFSKKAMLATVPVFGVGNVHLRLRQEMREKKYRLVSFGKLEGGIWGEGRRPGSWVNPTESAKHIALVPKPGLMQVHGCVPHGPKRSTPGRMPTLSFRFCATILLPATGSTTVSNLSGLRQLIFFLNQGFILR